MGNLAARKGDLGTIAARLRPATAYDVVRMLLGLLLLVAGGLKAHQLATEPVLATGLLDSRWVLIATVEFELFFGLWLLARLCPWFTWAAALGCFGLFACVSLAKALGGAASCGCFGRVQVNPWHTCTLDAASVLALLLWRPSGVKSSAWLPSRAVMLRGTVVFLVWLSVGIPAGVAMGGYQPTLLGEDGVLLGPEGLVILEPEKWVGKRFPLLPFVDIDQELKQGDWMIILYHDDCPDCQKLFARLPDVLVALRRESRKAAFIVVPPNREPDVRSLVAVGGLPCRWGRLASDRKWFVETPTAVLVHDGVVTKLQTKTDLANRSLEIGQSSSDCLVGDELSLATFEQSTKARRPL